MKRRYLFMCAVFLTVFMVVGCSKNVDQKESSVKIEEGENDSENEKNEAEISETEISNKDMQAEKENEEQLPEENKGVQDDKQKSYRVTVYYVDDSSAAVLGKSVEVSDEFDIWNALKTNGILTAECELISMKLNADQTMDLDFNHATADRINSMGTTGETEIIGCIVNTYLDAYDCTGIRLLEEGQDFVSSHGAEFSKYPGRIDFD